MAKKIIFSNSYSPRTGHNFFAEVLKVYTDAEILVHERSETRLTSLLEEYYKIYDSHIYHKTDKQFFDELFINNLRTQITSYSKQNHVIIKDTSFKGVEHINRVFPEDIQILLVRDPLAVLKSLFKGMALGKKDIKSKIKKILTPIGIYPLYYAFLFNYKYSKQIPNLKDFNVIYYEKIVLKDEKTLLKLKELFKSKKTLKNIKKEIDEIKVINSSFTKETGAEKIWDAKKKSSSFNPIKRKGHNLLIRSALKIGSYSLRKKLGYV